MADLGGGQSIIIDTGLNLETAVIASVGTAGGTTLGGAISVGTAVVPVASAAGFAAGQTITLDSGANLETAVIASTAGGGRGGNASITVTAPLRLTHAAGAQVSGSGITLVNPLARAHAIGAQFAGRVPTPGAPNQYSRRQQ